MCYFVEYLDNTKRFSNWLHKSVLDFSYGRYRPFFDFYNMVTWKYFGAIPWLHHLNRWLMHFGAVAFFSASFIIIARDKTEQDLLFAGEIRTKSLIIPLGLLIYIWMYFPNVPAARLGPQELPTVFFLGLCNLMLAFVVTHNSKDQKKLYVMIPYGLLYVGFIGLSISKEINIAVMLWITIFYYGLLIRKWSWNKTLAGIPLLLIFFYTLKKIIIASNNNYYGVTPVTLDLIADNLRWITIDLFQVETSLVITAFFAALFLILLYREGNKLIKRRTDNELIFIILLLGEFVCFYLIVSTSWAKVLRYWYVIIPVFTTLLAFSARSVLEISRTNFATIHRLTAIVLVGFLAYFIGCNYYNFLLQSVAQHSLRQAESALIDEISHLHDQGNYVYILLDKNDPDAELLHHLVAYYRQFSPRFHDKNYTIHTSPPEKADQLYYVVSRRQQPDKVGIHKHIRARRDYVFLNYAHRLSRLLQRQKPIKSKDAGVHLLRRYEWFIYRGST